MRKKNILLVLATFAFSQILTAQNEREITLNEAIALARTQSVDAAVALNELKTAYWEYRTFRADLLPEVESTAPCLPAGNSIMEKLSPEIPAHPFPILATPCKV